MKDWKNEFDSLVRSIGSITYGKERWFRQSEDLWYDRLDGAYIDTDTLHKRIYEEIRLYDEEY